MVVNHPEITMLDLDEKSFSNGVKTGETYPCKHLQFERINRDDCRSPM